MDGNVIIGITFSILLIKMFLILSELYYFTFTCHACPLSLRIQHFDLLYQSLSDGLKIRQDGRYVRDDQGLALFGLKTKKKQLKTTKTKTRTATKVITTKQLLYYENVTREYLNRTVDCRKHSKSYQTEKTC